MSTIIKLLIVISLAREVLCEDIMLNSDKLGVYNTEGARKIIEIDEIYFFKRKYNRGRIKKGEWIIGSIES